MEKDRFRIFSDYPLLIVLALGAVIRLIFLWEYYYDPQWGQLLVDSLFHDHWARSIADGNLLGEEPFFRAPLYIYVLGLVYFISDNSLLAARVFGHLIGLAGVAATFLIAHRLFSKRTAVVAGILHAIYPIAIYFESELLVDSLFTTLILYSILFFLISLEKRQARFILFAGLFVGLAAITRGIILGMVPLYLIWYFIRTKDWKRVSGGILLFLLALSIPIIPVAIRNAVVGDDVVLIASSGGINFHIGNNDYADGYSATLPPPLLSNWELRDIEYQAEMETGREMKASEISAYYYRKGFNWILKNPGEFIGLYLTKLKFAFNNLEISNNRNLNYFFDTNIVLKLIPLNFAMVFPFAIIGVLMSIWREQTNKGHWFIAIFALWYILLISLFFINARFRLPVIPYLIILGSFGFFSLVSSLFRYRLSVKVAVSLIAGIIAVIVAILPINEVSRDDIKSALFNRANYRMSLGDISGAVSLYDSLLTLNPSYPDANLNLGAAYFKSGQIERSKSYFLHEIKYHPTRAMAYSNLASAYYLQSDYDSALEYSEKAIALKPYLLDANLIRLRTFYSLGDTTGFEASLKNAEDTVSDKAALYLEAGIIYSAFQIYGKAIAYLTSALQAKKPAVEINDAAFYQVKGNYKSAEEIKARAAYQLGYLYGIRGNMAESIEMSKSAISLDSTMVEAYVNLINAYNAAGKRDSATHFIDIAVAKFPENNLLRQLQNSMQ